MTRQLISIVIAACTLGFSPAAAAPIQLDAAAWTAAAAGLSVVTENFSGFAAGPHPDPLTLANGSFSFGAFVLVNNASFCGDLDACLGSTSTIGGTRTFSAFPAGTTLWSVSDFFAIDASDRFRVTVVGGGGTSVFEQTGATTFWGFGDSLGLTSVSFLNLGNTRLSVSNYTFDDVSIARPAVVPEPASMLLLGSSVGTLAVWRRRRDRSSRGLRAGSTPGQAPDALRAD